MDIDDQDKDINTVEYCPAHSIVNINDCMNINAVEHDSQLYI